jgi:hypothetical protein
LKLLLLAGVLALVAGRSSGTFATFNAEVTSAGNSFATGTLFLHETKQGGSTCTSESSSDNLSTTNCDILFTVNNITNGNVSSANLTLNNAGTINASDIKFSVPNCTVGNNSGVTGTSTTFGSAPTCTNFQLTIQETNSSFSSNTYCAYGTDSSGTCAFLAGDNLGTATSLTTLLTTGAATATLNASANRYYTVNIKPVVATDNSLQNRKVTFDIHWHIDQ